MSLNVRNLAARLFQRFTKKSTLADAVRVLAEGIAKNQSVEFRDEAGAVVGAFVPAPPPTPTELLIPWEPGITREELDGRAAEPGFTFEEVKKRLGWA